MASVWHGHLWRALAEFVIEGSLIIDDGLSGGSGTAHSRQEIFRMCWMSSLLIIDNWLSSLIGYRCVSVCRVSGCCFYLKPPSRWAPVVGL